jgi:lactate dehydrogenase-like 2-hydroxyacid dehydrogenase
MRKISLIGLAMLIVSIPTFAGDYLTNTNQNAAFLRMIARLLSFNNVIVTSHQAFFTHEAMENIAATTLQNIKDFINHKPLLNEVKK